ncbi:MAG: ABC transporter substrate-binding protein [Proteiniphilum sp.]|nr:ABC transporter substrate-binding protein [Proteiniphilum sp.]
MSFFLLSWGCQPGQNRDKSDGEGEFLTTVTIRYAEGFSIDHFGEYTKVTIHNPWTNEKKPYAVYYLYKKDVTGPPSDGIKLKIPLSSLAVNTFSYFEFLQLLDETDAITGVTDGFRIYTPTILHKMETGEIIDLGDPFNPNVERTMSLKPQAIINSAYAQPDSYSERLIQAGFPIIYSLEWMEKSPLARAEWIKMIAAFFDKEEEADSIFTALEWRYLELQERVKLVSQQHSIMAGDNFQGTWYVPGGNSFYASLFRDAGLDYRYKNNKESGSIGLDIESVLTQFGKAALWFGCEADTYGELAEKDAKYLLLESVKKRQVFNNHNRTTPSGGNDYFESAIANPDLILSDLVKAAYPELLPHYSLTYIKPLEERPAREK